MVDKEKEALEVVEKALREVQARLRDGRIQPEKFNMNSWCGTAMCIGAHADEILQDVYGPVLSSHIFNALNDARYHGQAMEALFYPGSEVMGFRIGYEKSEQIYNHATPEDAIKAIDNYFANKDAHPWKGVMPEVTAK